MAYAMKPAKSGFKESEPQRRNLLETLELTLPLEGEKESCDAQARSRRAKTIMITDELTL
ncbi:hypothetical protein CDL15_Pgr026484 [Punica granatum]|uniref:Uncharacterized protein n=1 Tax=Punica granatum TaxID=22663 RepID=A0A218WKQ6_PUNGR|nr:hypothetical protein CDL15_Pgr026484 [Punica granatum]